MCHLGAATKPWMSSTMLKCCVPRPRFPGGAPWIPHPCPSFSFPAQNQEPSSSPPLPWRVGPCRAVPTGVRSVVGLGSANVSHGITANSVYNMHIFFVQRFFAAVDVPAGGESSFSKVCLTCGQKSGSPAAETGLTGAEWPVIADWRPWSLGGTEPAEWEKCTPPRGRELPWAPAALVPGSV